MTLRTGLAVPGTGVETQVGDSKSGDSKFKLVTIIRVTLEPGGKGLALVSVKLVGEIFND